MTLCSAVTSEVTATATSAACDWPAAVYASHRRALLRAGAVPVGDDHARALGGQPPRGGPADARTAAGDQRHAGSQRLGPGAAAQLGLFPRPVTRAGLL